MRILVVDDDPAVCGSIDRALRLEGYEVHTAGTGGGALEALALDPPDALVLDLQLPDIDGLTVCRRLRAAGDDTPVLMLTARDAIDDRVQGLDAGADDYLVKPFALAELLARLRALLRRRSGGDAEVLRFGDLSLDTSTREAYRGERPFTLTRIEFDLLELFLRHPRQVLTPRDHPRPGLGLQLRLDHEFPRGVHRLPPAQDRGRGRTAPPPHRRAVSATCCATHDVPQPSRAGGHHRRRGGHPDARRWWRSWRLGPRWCPRSTSPSSPRRRAC